MRYESRSIAQEIDCLARLTGAPESFVEQVRELFGKKGISLEEDVKPYIKALEEAFRREETIRFSTQRAKQSISRLQHNFQRIGRAYVEQLSQMKKLQSSLQQQSRRLGDTLKESHGGATQVTIRGDHRTFVTRLEREEPPLVPGPDEIQ